MSDSNEITIFGKKILTLGHGRYSQIDCYEINELNQINISNNSYLDKKHELRHNNLIAIKHYTNYSKYQYKLKNEVSVLKLLQYRSKYIVHLLDTKLYKNNEYLLYEPCLGGSLSQHILHSKSNMNIKNKIYIHDIRNMFGELLSAMCHLEKHCIIHRDIKSSNLLIDCSGRLKLCDFSSAKILSHRNNNTNTNTATTNYNPSNNTSNTSNNNTDNNNVTTSDVINNVYRTYTITGTAYCMAPEMVACMIDQTHTNIDIDNTDSNNSNNSKNNSRYNRKATTLSGYAFSVDYWNMGILLYELMTYNIPNWIRSTTTITTSNCSSSSSNQLSHNDNGDIKTYKEEVEAKYNTKYNKVEDSTLTNWPDYKAADIVRKAIWYDNYDSTLTNWPDYKAADIVRKAIWYDNYENNIATTSIEDTNDDVLAELKIDSNMRSKVKVGCDDKQGDNITEETNIKYKNTANKFVNNLFASYQSDTNIKTKSYYSNNSIYLIPLPHDEYYRITEEEKVEIYSHWSISYINPQLMRLCNNHQNLLAYINEREDHNSIDSMNSSINNTNNNIHDNHIILLYQQAIDLIDILLTINPKKRYMKLKSHANISFSYITDHKSTESIDCYWSTLLKQHAFLTDIHWNNIELGKSNPSFAHYDQRIGYLDLLGNNNTSYNMKEEEVLTKEQQDFFLDF